MSYCFNPTCKNPKNPDSHKFCQSCGSKLMLREHYRAIEPLGSGTYSRTFLAVDEDIPSKPFCVIKQFFSPTIGTETQKAAELFQREALQLDRLGQHPQIPRLLAYFERDKRQYLVQEFMDGENLETELKKTGAFSESQIIQLLRQLLRLLQFVHSQQVIHRDIKPANIIRRTQVGISPGSATQGSDRELVLVGFGSSKTLPPIARQGSATVIGSPEYTAPEQLEGKPAFASDLYSLGMTCIQLLTQTNPFNLRHGNRWDWRQYLPRPVSAALGEIIDKMLETKLSQRYQSAEEVLADLERLEPRNWECVETFPAGDRLCCVAIGPDSQIIASGGEDNRIRLWYPGRRNYADTLGNWLSGHSGWVQAVAFSPDGRFLISGSCDRSIKIWDLGTGKLMRFLGDWFAGHTNWVNAIAINTTGSIIVSGSADRTIKIWNFTNGKQLANISAHQAGVETVAIAPDSKLLASGSSDRTVKLWDVSTGKPIATLTGHTDTVRAIAFSPDSQILASGSNDTTIKLWQINTQEEIAKLMHSDWINCLAFSPRSPLLVAGCRNGAIVLWNPYTAEQIGTLPAHSAAVNAIAFNPTGELLVTGSADGTLKLWRISAL